MMMSMSEQNPDLTPPTTDMSAMLEHAELFFTTPLMVVASTTLRVLMVILGGKLSGTAGKRVGPLAGNHGVQQTGSKKLLALTLHLQLLMPLMLHLLLLLWVTHLLSPILSQIQAALD